MVYLGYNRGSLLKIILKVNYCDIFMIRYGIKNTIGLCGIPGSFLRFP